MTVFKEMSAAAVQPDLADDRPAEAAGFVSTALPGESICEGWVTSFEVVDKVGDIGTYGMFAASLKKFRDQNRRIPVTDSHDWSSRGIIGYALPNEVVEVRKGGPGGKGGLFARMHLLTEDSKTAKFLFHLMQELPLQMSYAFDSVSERRDPKTKANRLLSVQLLELTVCLFGAVEQTSVRARKQREAIMRMPEYKTWAKAKAQRDLDLMTALVDQDRPNRRSVKEPGYDPVADFEALVLADENDADPVSKFDRVAKAAAKDMNGNCAVCGQFITNPPTTVPHGYGYLHVKCPKCSAINLLEDDVKGLTQREFNAQSRRLTVYYKDREHNAKMLAQLKKAQQKREVDELTRFATGKPAPSKKTDSVKAALDSFDAVLKPAKKSTTNEVESLFTAPAIRKDQLQ